MQFRSSSSSSSGKLQRPEDEEVLVVSIWTNLCRSPSLTSARRTVSTILKEVMEEASLLLVSLLQQLDPEKDELGVVLDSNSKRLFCGMGGGVP